MYFFSTLGERFVLDVQSRRSSVFKRCAFIWLFCSYQIKRQAKTDSAVFGIASISSPARRRPLKIPETAPIYRVVPSWGFICALGRIYLRVFVRRRDDFIRSRLRSVIPMSSMHRSGCKCVCRPSPGAVLMPFNIISTWRSMPFPARYTIGFVVCGCRPWAVFFCLECLVPIVVCHMLIDCGVHIAC